MSRSLNRRIRRNSMLAAIFCFLQCIFLYSSDMEATRRLAEQGDREAQFKLAELYAKGEEIKQDLFESIKWLQKSANQGFPEAQLALGFCYRDGKGFEEDEVEAVKWFRKAAEQGDALAQFNLGLSYGNGRGIGKDESEAVKWYRKAAQQGLPEAQLSLGICYGDGIGVEKDEAEAVKWYRKAAEQGIPLAQLSLGICYEDGIGVEKDEAEAVKWFQKAAEQEESEAEIALERLNKSNGSSYDDWLPWILIGLYIIWILGNPVYVYIEIKKMKPMLRRKMLIYNLIKYIFWICFPFILPHLLISPNLYVIIFLVIVFGLSDNYLEKKIIKRFQQGE